MQKRVLAILLLLMLVSTSLLCSAEEETIEWPTGLIDALGDCTVYILHGTAREYWLSDARDYYFEANVYATEAVYKPYGGIMIYKFPENVVDLRTDEGIEWEKWQIDQAYNRRLFIQNCCYEYTAEGELYEISILLSDCWVEISNLSDPHPVERHNDLPHYPQEGPETMLSRLLDPAKAPDAIAELTARAEGTYVEPTPPSYTAYIWCILGGAAVAAVTAWAITYFVMRKRAKNAYRLAGNGEIPASAGEAIVPAEDAPDGAPDSTPTDHTSA